MVKTNESPLGYHPEVQIAKWLDMSVSCLRRHRYMGRIKYIQIERKIFYEIEHVREFMKQFTVDPLKKKKTATTKGSKKAIAEQNGKRPPGKK